MPPAAPGRVSMGLGSTELPHHLRHAASSGPPAWLPVLTLLPRRHRWKSARTSGPPRTASPSTRLRKQSWWQPGRGPGDTGPMSTASECNPKNSSAPAGSRCPQDCRSRRVAMCRRGPSEWNGSRGVGALALHMRGAQAGWCKEPCGHQHHAGLRPSPVGAECSQHLPKGGVWLSAPSLRGPG